MRERFVKEARGVAADAQTEARALGSPTVEAEHLLLALARRTDGGAALLDAAGLDPDRLNDALAAEFAHSLAGVGVQVGDFDLRQTRRAEEPRWGASAKLALERALGAAVAQRQNRVAAGHVLVGVLGAREGTVPRALRGAGVDQAGLQARAVAALSAP